MSCLPVRKTLSFSTKVHPYKAEEASRPGLPTKSQSIGLGHEDSTGQHQVPSYDIQVFGSQHEDFQKTKDLRCDCGHWLAQNNFFETIWRWRKLNVYARWRQQWPVQLLLLLIIFFIVFGPNVASMHGAWSRSSCVIGLNAALIACMAILGLDLASRIFFTPTPPFWSLILDIAVVALVIVDISWCSIPIAQYRASMFQSQREGALLFVAAVVLNTRCGYCALLVAKLGGAAIKKAGSCRRQHPEIEEKIIYQDVCLLVIVLTAFSLLSPREEGSRLMTLLQAAESLQPATLASAAATFEGALQGTGMVLLAVNNSTSSLDLLPVASIPAIYRQSVSSPSSQFTAVLDISSRRKDDAAWDVWLSITIIGILVLAAVLQTLDLTSSILRLHDSLMAVLREECPHILDSIPLPQESATSGSFLLEAAVKKMARILHQVGPSGRTDGHALRLLHGEEDNATKEWLVNVMSNQRMGSITQPRASRRFSAFDRPRKSILGMLARFQITEQTPEEDAVDQGEYGDHLPPPIAADPEVAAALDMRKALQSVNLVELDTWDFDVFQHSKEHLVACLCQMFMQQGLCQTKVASVEAVAKCGDGSAFGSPRSFLAALQHVESRPEYTPDRAILDLQTVWNVATETCSRMHDVAYHNFYHVVDVTHTCFRFLRLADDSCLFSVWEQAALLVAAMCHDLDHPGVNNAFLIATWSDLAQTYNDSSVLESHHLAVLYRMMTQPGLDLFQKLDAAKWREVRKHIINAVIHTDMTFHFPLVSKIELFSELRSKKVAASASGRDVVGSPNSAASIQSAAVSNTGSTVPQESMFVSVEDRQLLLAVLLHCADIGNSVMPFHMAESWAKAVTQEFFTQGDKEAALGIPISPLMDRNKSSLPLSQINFIEFIVAPLFFKVTQLLPELSMTTVQLTQNLRIWYDRYALELDSSAQRSVAEKESEKAKMSSRWAAYLKTYGSQLAKLPKPPGSASSSRRGSGGSHTGQLAIERKGRSRSNSNASSSGIVPKFFRRRSRSMISNAAPICEDLTNQTVEDLEQAALEKAIESEGEHSGVPLANLPKARSGPRVSFLSAIRDAERPEK